MDCFGSTLFALLFLTVDETCSTYWKQAKLEATGDRAAFSAKTETLDELVEYVSSTSSRPKFHESALKLMMHMLSENLFRIPPPCKPFRRYQVWIVVLVML